MVVNTEVPGTAINTFRILDVFDDMVAEEVTDIMYRQLSNSNMYNVIEMFTHYNIGSSQKELE